MWEETEQFVILQLREEVHIGGVVWKIIKLSEKNIENRWKNIEIGKLTVLLKKIVKYSGKNCENLVRKISFEKN